MKNVQFKEFFIKGLFEKIKTNTFSYKVGDLNNFLEGEFCLPALIVEREA